MYFCNEYDVKEKKYLKNGLISFLKCMFFNKKSLAFMCIIIIILFVTNENRKMALTGVGAYIMFSGPNR